MPPIINIGPAPLGYQIELYSNSHGIVPTDLSNSTSWFRADLGITLNGSTVASWADNSRAAICPTLEQSDDSLQPTYIASGINSLPDIQFHDVTNSYLYGSTDLLGTTGITLFVTFKTSNSGTEFIWGMQYNDYHYSIFMNPDASHPGQVSFFNGNADFAMSPLTYNDNQPHVLIASYDSTSGDIKLYIDSTTPIATATGSGTIQNSVADKNSVGSSTGSAANDRYFTGHIPELGSYSRAITPSEVASLMTYLKDRAGI